MHLTAESTSKESCSLAKQTESRLPDREIKIGKEDATESWEWQRSDKRESERVGSGHCHPVLSTSFDMTDGKHSYSSFSVLTLRVHNVTTMHMHESKTFLLSSFLPEFGKIMTQQTYFTPEEKRGRLFPRVDWHTSALPSITFTFLP